MNYTLSSDTVFKTTPWNLMCNVISKHLLSEYSCHFVNACVTFLLEWPCILYLKYYSDIFNYNGLSETCIWQPPIILFFVLKLNMHSGLFFFFFCPTLPKTLTVGSWQTPQMGSGCNWTFINHPLPRATKFLQPFLPSETFSSHWGMR